MSQPKNATNKMTAKKTKSSQNRQQKNIASSSSKTIVKIDKSKKIRSKDYKNLHILHIASESVPFFKTGGLADVVGSISKEQVKLGAKVSVCLPKYRDLPTKYLAELKFIKHFDVYMSWRKQYAGIFLYHLDGVDFYFIDNEYYFGRVGYYGYGDDGERFGFFTIACLELIAHLQLNINIIHAHDWHTGMAAPLYHEKYCHFPYYQNLHFILTIHNPAYQGCYDKDVLGNIFGLNEETYYNGLMRFKSGISYLKAGIVYSDFITTVSKTHCQELLNGISSYDLEGLLQTRSSHFIGIVNGIDYDDYNPKIDSAISYNYDITNVMENKPKCKQTIQKEMGLPVRNVPLFTFISRLTWQKGVEILIGALKRIIGNDIQVIIIGSGDGVKEQEIQRLRDANPDKIAVFIGFNDQLARRAYSGADFLIMPSLFEPCGINQMIALHYGTIPIVRECGGLKDTVIPYNRFEKTGTGFSFIRYDEADLTDCLGRALETYYHQEDFKHLIISAMQTECSWRMPAVEYLDLYERAIGRK